MFRKVENGRLVGDDPVPEAHGEIASLEGGLLLNGNDSWMDMGNFEGEYRTRYTSLFRSRF